MSRVDVSTASGVRLTFGAARRMEIFAYGWTTGVFTAVVAVGGAPSSGLTKAIALMIVVFCVALWWVFLWKLLGREVIAIEGNTINVRQSLLGIGSARRYRAAAMLNVHACPRIVRPYFGGAITRGVGQIEFDYEGRRERIGFGLEQSDAIAVVAVLDPFVGSLGNPHI